MMIVQEAVNNAAKHSGANQVIVTNRMIDRVWQLRIDDNGKGFNLASAQKRKDSNGLGNMQERAAVSDAKIIFETGAGKGTGVLLSVIIK